MSDPATYQAYSFRPVQVTDDASSRRTVVGKIRWRISPELPLHSYMKHWETKGYKTGLNIPNTQTIYNFSYDDENGSQIVMLSSPGDVHDLEVTLGTQTGYQWFAFTNPPHSPRRAYIEVPEHDHTVEFTVRLTLTSPRLYREVIGTASRHPGASFTEGSMNSLWVVPVPPYPAP
jgi:hypothetical protein